MVGYVGSTGNSSGAHLHFEVRIGPKDSANLNDRTKKTEPLYFIQKSTIPQRILDQINKGIKEKAGCQDFDSSLVGVYAGE